MNVLIVDDDQMICDGTAKAAGKKRHFRKLPT